VDDVEEELHSLLRFDLGDWPSFYPLCELVHGDKQMRVTPGTFLRGPTRSSPQTANNHVIEIVWSAWAGRWVCRA
jgi:hypothetical protein